MNEFRRLAAKIDEHMRQLAAHGVSESHAIINRMMGYVPDLHQIWVGTSDQQFMALSREFPGFYRYAHIMEDASEAERNKASRAYDGMAELSQRYCQLAESKAELGASRLDLAVLRPWDAVNYPFIATSVTWFQSENA